MAYYFLPPTVAEGPAGMGALFYRYKLNRANSVLQRTDGSYYSVRTPSVDETQSALYYYPGGHKNLISESERTSLIAAGYGANIIEEQMTPGRYNMQVYQGSTFSLRPQWKIDGTYVDVTGYSAAMSVKNSPTSVSSIIDLTSANGRITVGTTDGKFTLNLTAATTTGLAAGNYVYDLEVTSPGGVVTRLLEGGFTVYEGVTS